MVDDKIKEIITKLNSYLLHHEDDSSSPVSPTLGVQPSLNGKLDTNLLCRDDLGMIHKEICVELLNKNELCMLHTNLHRFYPSRAKGLTKVDIEKLHKKVSKLINHVPFDILDRVCERE